MAFFFSRDTKVFMKWAETANGTDDALYEIPVLDGFSFSQATNTSEITLNEAANSTGGSKRGRAMFTDFGTCLLRTRVYEVLYAFLIFGRFQEFGRQR